MSKFNHLNYFFLFFLLLKIVIELYLDLRNKNHIIKNKNSIPSDFSDIINQSDHHKAVNYNITKINAGIKFSILELLIFLFWTLGGGLNFLNELILKLNLNALHSGVIIILSFSIISTIISIPKSIYYTFVIEEQFGFNKTTAKIFIVDLFKGLMLSLILGIPLLYVLLWVLESLGPMWWIYAWFLLTFFQLLIMYIHPTLIAPLFNKFIPISDNELRIKIEKLLSITGFISKGIFVKDASKRSNHGNAYFTGFGKNKRIVFFDTILKKLNHDEIISVLAHELGHFKKKHILKLITISLLSTLLGFYVLGNLYNSDYFFHAHGVSEKSNYMALLLFSLVASTYTFILTPFFSWYNRKFEFEADAFAARYSNPDHAISGLTKLYKDNASSLTPDPLYSKFYYSHPPAIERIKFLNILKTTSN